MAIKRSEQPSLLALITPQPAPLRYFARMAGGIAVGAALVAWFAMPLWGASIMVLALLAQPTAQTWRAVGTRFGVPFAVLSVLLYLQGFHTVEHIAQSIEFHILRWPPRQSTGLLSGLNVETVHFLWNWAVLLVAAYLLRAGLRSGPRNLWGILFIGWAIAHTLEHTYLMYQYLATVRVMLATGGSLSFAEGLPGVIGRNGWLATNSDTNALAGFICRLAPTNLITPRLDVHFWWNVGETALMLAFALGAVRRIRGSEKQAVASTTRHTTVADGAAADDYRTSSGSAT